MHEVLSVKDLHIKLKIEGRIYSVVKDLSFNLKKGQTVALIGESGCGKSLTAMSILRILPQPPALPSEGEILYGGHNLLTLKESQMRNIRGKAIAMIFQDPLNALNPVYSIKDQLLEVALRHHNLTQEEAIHSIIKSLEDVHLPRPKEIMHLYPHELSGGMLQRVMIAMALIGAPDILIADEPTTALDVTIQAQILHLLRELQEKKGMAILLITHDMRVVAQNADEVIVMYAGECMESALVETIFNSPSHPYTQALFGSRLDPTLRKKKLATIPGNVARITERSEGCQFHPRCSSSMEICKKGQVPLFTLKQPDHHTKCWLYGKT